MAPVGDSLTIYTLVLFGMDMVRDEDERKIGRLIRGRDRYEIGSRT